MANYAKGLETKERLISLTYQKLKTASTSAVTVRDLAKESGDSPSALYRYFGSLDHLIVVASVGFMERYVRDYVALLETDPDPLSLYERGWWLFDQCAFDRPDIFYALFWGNYNGEFVDAVEEYCSIFPFPGAEKDSDILKEIIFNSDIYQRDLFLLRRAVAAGQISEGKALYYGRVNPLIAKGLLQESIDKDAAARDLLRKECDALVRVSEK